MNGTSVLGLKKICLLGGNPYHTREGETESVAEIVTTDGDRILVDAKNLEWLSEFGWYLNPNGYAIAGTNGGTRKVLMHRLLAGLERGCRDEVDHINGNRIDNREANLRVCTRQENSMNRHKNPDTKSGLKGVSESYGEKWAARISKNGRRMNIGVFDTPEEAHEVYRAVAQILHDEFANDGDQIVRDSYSRSTPERKYPGLKRFQAIAASRPVPAPEFKVGETIATVEKRYIEIVLKHFLGNQTRAAEALGISVKGLYMKIRAYSIPPIDLHALIKELEL